MKTALVLKGIFPETNKYVYVLRTKFQVSSIILKSFRQRVRRGVGLKLAPPPTSKRSFKKLTQIKVNKVANLGPDIVKGTEFLSCNVVNILIFKQFANLKGRHKMKKKRMQSKRILIKPTLKC